MNQTRDVTACYGLTCEHEPDYTGASRNVAYVHATTHVLAATCYDAAAYVTPSVHHYAATWHDAAASVPATAQHDAARHDAAASDDVATAHDDAAQHDSTVARQLFTKPKHIGCSKKRTKN